MRMRIGSTLVSMRIGPTLRLLLVVFTAVFLVFVLLPLLTTKQYWTSQVVITHWHPQDGRLQRVFNSDSVAVDVRPVVPHTTESTEVHVQLQTEPEVNKRETSAAQKKTSLSNNSVEHVPHRSVPFINEYQQRGPINAQGELPRQSVPFVDTLQQKLPNVHRFLHKNSSSAAGRSGHEVLTASPNNTRQEKRKYIAQRAVLPHQNAHAPSDQRHVPSDQRQKLPDDQVLTQLTTPPNNVPQRNPDAQVQIEHWKSRQQQRTNIHPLYNTTDEPLKYIPEIEDFADPSLEGFCPLTREEMNGVEAFVFFVGWQRSGHSIIGSLLDGHPDVIVAHEFFLISSLHRYILRFDGRPLLFNQLLANSYRDSRDGARSGFHNEKGYNLKLPNSWQGHFRKLRVIGDKTAGDVTSMYARNSTVFDYLVDRLSAVVKVPLKAINVVRNPFDMIATLTLYRGSGMKDVKVQAAVGDKYDNYTLLQWATQLILSKAQSMHEIEMKTYNWDLMRMYSEDFIRDPKKVMVDLCKFLGLECTEEYLQQCAAKTFKSPSKSRHLIKWDQATIEWVNKAINKVPFLRRYSFEGE